MKILKPLRVVVAVIFMLFTTLLFLHFNSFLEIPDISVILELQYIPSLLKFLQGVTWIAFGFVVFTLLALLFGRIYCSFICPLGILQDFFIRVNRLLSKRNKNRYSYHQSLKWLRHLITGIALVSLILGSTSLLIWLDPYSHFGRMATHLLQPIYYFGNNGLALIVNYLGYYGIYRIEVHTFHWATFLFASFILVLLLALTRIKGRFFCNSLCPVGGFLSWISKVSIFRLAFEPSKCISCSRCEKACKAESIDYKNMKIDFDRCVACYNCVDTCNVNAITYQVRFHKKAASNSKNETIDSGKRQTLKSILFAGTALSGLSFTIDKESFSSFVSKNPAKSKLPVLPPGAISITHFKGTCTACHLCISACPSNVLQSTFIGFGIDGMFIPKMNFDVNYCQYECNLCGDICPTGAIKPLKLEDKKITQLGKVQFIKDNCVVSQLEKDCGACAEHCPTKAVKMVPYPNKSGKNLFIPEVNTDLCIGCGACEHPCPVRPHKAIFVESNASHLLAQKPVIEKIETPKSEQEEFPF